ncbi:MAG: AAA domain-containing protein [Gammaproteobacteria bacterium]|nr:AAA domain-containing protein [Gammaproteobacteria bacterium]
MKYLGIKPDHETRLKSRKGLPERVHVFDNDSIEAVNTALAAKRPLLVRGEPGIGKSQLARAVAKELKRAFVQQVIDAHCEPRDLLWHLDVVQRLADAQLGSVLDKEAGVLENTLQLQNYLHPRALWWAFNWDDAKAQADKLKLPQPSQEEAHELANGCVLLIDEIDKAEMDVPNGLLEALGEGCFTPTGRDGPVTVAGEAPLVIITTNEERALPNAFLRRCLVLYLTLPTEGRELADLLAARGQAHFPGLDKTVLEAAAGQLVKDRLAAGEMQLQPLPGQAEYLDLLRALSARAPGDKQKQLALLAKISRFVVKKHLGEGA